MTSLPSTHLRPSAPRALASLVLAAAMLLGSGASSAHAQRRGRRAPATTSTSATASPSATDRARALFQEGVGLVAEGQLAEAEDRFRQALALHDAPAIRYNLASVLFEQGELPEAAALDASVLADASAPASVRTAATQLREHLEEHAGWARFELEGGNEGVTFVIDGTPIADAHVEVPVAARSHEVVAMRGDQEVARRTFDAEAGVHRLHRVSLPIATPEAPVVAAHSSALEDQDWFWPAVAGGSIVVVVTAGILIGVAASGTETPVSGNFSPGVITWP